MGILPAFFICLMREVSLELFPKRYSILKSNVYLIVLIYI